MSIKKNIRREKDNEAKVVLKLKNKSSKIKFSFRSY